MSIKACVIAALALLSAPAFAADPAPANADERRLSPAEVQKILDAASTRPAMPVPGGPVDESAIAPRAVHGEMGVAIGTGGYREAFGTTVLPLGSDGVAILSFDTADFGNRYSRRRR
jgi:hypothetical protein